MPKYTEKTWKAVDAAAEIIALGIIGAMETDLEERLPDFTPEEREYVYRRMVKFADRMLAIAEYDPSTMDWHRDVDAEQDDAMALDRLETDAYNLK